MSLRNALDVLDYIEQWYQYWLDRPEMYAANPGEMEAMFIVLETIREFVIQPDVEHVGPGTIGYPTYCKEHGLGAALFTTRDRGGKWSAPHADREDFEPFCAFMKGYLTSKHRAHHENEEGEPSQ